MLYLAVFLFCLAFIAAIDPYAVLGISRDADDKTIKTAYRQMSKQYHPDKNLSPEAHDKFIEIGEAYDILSDPQKKRNYDQFGDPNGAGGFGGAGGAGGAGFDFGDMFNQFLQETRTSFFELQKPEIQLYVPCVNQGFRCHRPIEVPKRKKVQTFDIKNM